MHEQRGQGHAGRDATTRQGGRGGERGVQGGNAVHRFALGRCSPAARPLDYRGRRSSGADAPTQVKHGEDTGLSLARGGHDTTTQAGRQQGGGGGGRTPKSATARAARPLCALVSFNCRAASPAKERVEAAVVAQAEKTARGVALPPQPQAALRTQVRTCEQAGKAHRKHANVANKKKHKTKQKLTTSNKRSDSEAARRRAVVLSLPAAAANPDEAGGGPQGTKNERACRNGQPTCLALSTFGFMRVLRRLAAWEGRVQ